MAESEKEPIGSELLQKIFGRSCRRLRTLAAEGEDELLEVIHRKAALMQDARDEGGKEKDLVVTFTHTIKINFTKSTQEDKLGGNIKVAMAMRGRFEDPDQEKLDFEDEEEGDG